MFRPRGSLEPPCDGVAGTTGETGRGRNAHALDSHARYLVELLPSAAKTAVRRARIRAERSPAYLATVTPSATRLGGKPAVATDGDAALSKVLALWLGECLVLDGLHRSSVPGLKTRPFTNDLTYLRVTDQQRIPQAPVQGRLRPLRFCCPLFCALASCFANARSRLERSLQAVQALVNSDSRHVFQVTPGSGDVEPM